MAKRRAAEPLTFHVPWKRLPFHSFPEAPLLWTPPSGASLPALSRKRKFDAGAMAESSASPSKRRGGADGSAQSGAELEGRALDSGEPPGENRTLGEEPRDARPRRGGGDGGAGRAGPRRGECGAAQRQQGTHKTRRWRALGRLRHEDCQEFEASLGHTMSSRPAWTT
ncbi:uncharacterized protein C9orf40 homolog isoform X2 [Heterocephalus glaber]|uniref:Uncharacterized protein C9orf40 homolog isoform X2 n=1 Tax=Heterocephalus glaber TaxID=10181 RepID=A0AAX6RRJ9_HETGA|nr:uncharacterized protein C9orf40 homolog isoform X2 [Heterocephalus glaber]